MFYIGMSKQQLVYRWRPSQYKTTSLGPYIKQFGWDNIRHVVLKDGLTKDQAEQLEDLLIKEATRQEFCINQNRSGGIKRDNLKEYNREWQREYEQRPEVKERKREWQREYDKKHSQTEKRKEYKHQWYLKKKQNV